LGSNRSAIVLVRPIAYVGIATTIIWGLFRPYEAAWVFVVVFLVVFEGYLILLFLVDRQRTIPPFAPPFQFSPDEIAVVKRYYFFFRSPMLARECSSALSLIGLTSFFWTPWLLYREEWLLAAVFGANYFIAGPASLKLNPLPFLNQGAANGSNMPAVVELLAVQAIIEKIQNARRSSP
jgi:hypothetical protein